MSIPIAAALAGAAGGGAAAGAGLSIIGSVLGAVGSAIAEKQARKDEEKARIAEEQRAEERYAGVGEAADIDHHNFTDGAKERAARMNAPVGTRPKMMGERYRDQDTELRAPQMQKPRGLGRPTGVSPGISVSQGATPLMTGGQPQPALAAPAALPKRRFQYDPGSGRIQVNTGEGR